MVGIYERIKKPVKDCYHGIPLKKDCEDCILFFMRENETKIRLLKMQLKAIRKKKECKE